MRVITGTARGAKLKTLDGLETRPTTDRIKEAIFSIIQFDIQDREILDLFAGSGQMGIEALSRGGTHATFVDNNYDIYKVIKENLEKTKFTDSATVINADYKKMLNETNKQYSLIFLDPPYGKELASKAITRIAERDLAVKGAIAVLETGKDEKLSDNYGKFNLIKQKTYGLIKISIYEAE